MNLIVAVSSDWGIGYKNELLFRIREDLQRFKKLTINKVVVMGHNTFKSLPGGKPLPSRTNIVLSKNDSLQIPGVITCNSMGSLKALLQNHDPREIFIIGGEKVYAQLLNYCERAYITKVEANPSADVFMTNIDKLPCWRLEQESLLKNYGEISYKFSIYTNGLYNAKNFFTNL